MPRKRNAVPKYLFHCSGQARVSIACRDFYLGKYGSPESLARYHSLLAIYAETGTLPDEMPVHQAETAVTVLNLIAEFRHRVLPRYESNLGTKYRIGRVLGVLEERFGSEAVDNFGPRKLELVRDELLSFGNCRRYVNDQIRDVLNLFRFGVARELVDAKVLTALSALDSLKRGEAPDRDKRSGVPLLVVEDTLPHLDAVVAKMVRLQLATAARPSEVFGMKPRMIEQVGNVWIYRPEKHKTQHHGKSKLIPIAGVAREILQSSMPGVPDEYCFLTRKKTPWDKDSYRRHITRTCEKHGIEKWTPYQLRHTALQAVRDAAGAEAAQALAGHSRLDTTEIYAKASLERAVIAAEYTPRIEDMRAG
jgi:integrase